MGKRQHEAGRVLVVDDNHDITDSFADVLESRGYEVARAYDGLTGLALANATSPDVVLVNDQMSQMTGLQVLSALAGKSPKRSAMKVIVMSGRGHLPSFREAAKKAGAFATIGRPEPLHHLFSLIQSALQG